MRENSLINMSCTPDDTAADPSPAGPSVPLVPSDPFDPQQPPDMDTRTLASRFLSLGSSSATLTQHGGASSDFHNANLTVVVPTFVANTTVHTPSCPVVPVVDSDPVVIDLGLD